MDTEQKGAAMGTPVINLCAVTEASFRACVQLQLANGQDRFVASNMKSLAQAYVNRDLTPLAIYDGTMQENGAEAAADDDRMVGFVMYQVREEIGYIMRLMIAAAHQRKGYGRAAMLEVIRRLKQRPDVRRIMTSYRRTNTTAAKLYEALGFTPVDQPADQDDPEEQYAELTWSPD